LSISVNQAFTSDGLRAYSAIRASPLNDRLTFGIARDGFDIVKPFRGTTLNDIDDALGAAFMLAQDDLAGHWPSLGIVPSQGVDHRAGGGQMPCQRARVQDRLTGPIASDGYSGCAASPSSVVRPNDQRGRGSRSQLGNSKNVVDSSMIAVGSMKASRNLRTKCSGSPRWPERLTVTGSLLVEGGGEAQRAVGQRGATLRAGDRIETPRGSRVDLSVAGGIDVRLNERSVAVLDTANRMTW
jgi:hypothetical protein